MTLLAEPSSVVLARDMVRHALDGWAFGPDLVHDARVVMSELVTNAVNAARGHEIRVRITRYEGRPLLECWDPAPALPTFTDAPVTAESGRGLPIVAAYSRSAGLRPAATGRGKVVWALM
ncbi:ATP-binding protein [Actinocorallia herbida]|nr:ATP-binding protein [Actinocorallia herbida]